MDYSSESLSQTALPLAVCQAGTLHSSEHSARAPGNHKPRTPKRRAAGCNYVCPSVRPCFILFTHEYSPRPRPKHYEVPTKPLLFPLSLIPTLAGATPPPPLPARELTDRPQATIVHFHVLHDSAQAIRRTFPGFDLSPSRPFWTTRSMCNHTDFSA